MSPVVDFGGHLSRTIAKKSSDLLVKKWAEEAKFTLHSLYTYQTQSTYAHEGAKKYSG